MNAAVRRAGRLPLGPPPKRRKPLVSVYPDDCECGPRDRGICQQNCKPVRHKISCRVVRGKGACNCGAVKPDRRPSFKLDPKGMPWPPSGVNVTRWNAARRYGGKLQDQIDQLAGIRNAIYLHPNDFAIGNVVYWMRDRKVRSGVVIEVLDNDYQPAVVRSAGHPRRYEYKPTIYAYCDSEGNKPCVCELPTGRRTECQKQKACPIPAIDKLLKRGTAVADAIIQSRPRGRVVAPDMETYSDAPLYDGPPGVKLMQSHSPAALAGLTAFVGPNERAARPFSLDLADYEVRNGGIYTRRFNVRLAKFVLNSAPLQGVLGKLFDAAFADKQEKIEAFKFGRLPVDKQIKKRQAQERKANNGWYTHGCGQWVHDQRCPCSVCKPKRKPRKKK